MLIFGRFLYSALVACLTLVCFPVLGPRCVFSRAWHPLCVFPRLTPVVCFPALDTRCVFYRAWHPLCVLPRLTPVVCVSRAWHPLCVFPRLTPVVCVSRAWHLHVFARFTFIVCVCYDWSVLITLVTKYCKTRQATWFLLCSSGYLVITGLHQYCEQGHVVASADCSCPVCSWGINSTSFRWPSFVVISGEI